MQNCNLEFSKVTAKKVAKSSDFCLAIIPVEATRESADLGVELDAPDLGRRRLERGDGGAGVDVEDADVAVERDGGGERAGGVRGEGDDPERVAPRGGADGGELVGAPGADGLVERGGEEQRRGPVVGRRRPRRRPDGLLVRGVHRLEPRELHRARFGRRRGGRRGGGTLGWRAIWVARCRGEGTGVWPWRGLGGGDERFREILFIYLFIGYMNMNC